MARTTPVNNGYTIINGSGTGSNGGRIDVWLEYKVTAQNASVNKSTIKVYFYAALKSGQSSDTWGGNGCNSSITIAGTKYTGVSNAAYDFRTTSVNALGNKTVTITHEANGQKSISLSGSFTTKSSYISGGNVSSTTVRLPAFALYSHTASAGAGSSITVTRTSSGYAGTGVISPGTRLYYGDTLRIAFTPSANHEIVTHTVNGSVFTSGGTHTVRGNVAIVATARPLASSVSATNADINTPSIITISRHSSAHKHTLTFTCGGLGGVIASMTSSTTIAWTVPEALYRQFPNAPSATCNITCSTYSGDVLLGTSSCSMTVRTTISACAPDVTGFVVDTNATTIGLTGDSSKLIRYQSTATCTIIAKAKNYATISSKLINNTAVSGGNSLSFSNASDSSFVFAATDSRGYTSSATVTPTMVAYIPLTLNATLARPSPTSNQVKLTFSGNYYNGSFGAANNTLTIQYRYRRSSGTRFSSWVTVGSGYVIASKSYATTSAITLSEDFNYMYSYVFEVRAIDGTTAYPLTTVTSSHNVSKGTPVYDWGENDFNFNVPVNINGTLSLNGVDIIDRIYPVGSTYISTVSTNPAELFGTGAWQANSKHTDGSAIKIVVPPLSASQVSAENPPYKPSYLSMYMWTRIS